MNIIYFYVYTLFFLVCQFFFKGEVHLDVSSGGGVGGEVVTFGRLARPHYIFRGGQSPLTPFFFFPYFFHHFFYPPEQGRMLPLLPYPKRN